MTGRTFLNLWLILQLAAGSAIADDYVFACRVDQDSITVGDRIVLRLTLRKPASDSSSVVPSLRLPSSFRVLESPPAISSREDTSTVVTQTLTLTSFETGSFTIPTPSVGIVRAAGDTLVLQADSIDILVASVLEEGVDDIGNIRGPRSIRPRIPSWAWFVTAAIIVLIGMAAWLWIRRRRKEAPVAEAIPTDWFAEVRRLADHRLKETADFIVYYTALSEAFRRYLESETPVDVMECTTFELARALDGSPIEAGRAAEIVRFLSEADIVKFARHAPGSQKARDDLDRVLRMMEGVAEDVKPPAEEEVSSP